MIDFALENLQKFLKYCAYLLSNWSNLTRQES
jgi:hypothetical protein